MAIFIALVVAGLIIYWFWYTKGSKDTLDEANNAPYKVETTESVPTLTEVVKEEVKPQEPVAPVEVKSEPVVTPKAKKTTKKAATTTKPKAPRKPKMTVVK